MPCLRFDMSFVTRMRALASDVRGQFAVLTTVVITPILILSGLAVDYHLAYNSKEKVQYAMDSAVIAGARALQEGKTQIQIETDVRGYFAAMMNDERHGLTCDPVVVGFPSGSSEVTAAATCWQQAVLLTLVGSDEIEFFVEASATFGRGKLDVAFVFDVSGSMADPITGTSDARLEALKAAALSAFSQILLPATDPNAGDVRIAIAPYDHQINVGSYFNAMTNKAAARTWPAQTRVQTGQECTRYRNNGTCRRWSPIYQTQADGSLFWDNVDYDITNTCISERAGDQAFTDAPPGAGNWFVSGEPVWFFGASDENKIAADEGTYSNSTGAFREPSGTAGNRTYGSCSSSQIVPLTSTAATLTTAVNGLSTNFATNGSLGFAMGWYLISPNWSSVWPSGSVPLAYDEPNAKKAIIMMTDGAFNTWRTDQGTYGNGWARMTSMCNAAKAEGVIIFTIVFDLNDATAQSVLSACASQPIYFYAPDTLADLDNAYDDIAGTISELRLKD